MCCLLLVEECHLGTCELVIVQCRLVNDGNNNKPITLVDWGDNGALKETLMIGIQEVLIKIQCIACGWLEIVI